MHKLWLIFAQTVTIFLAVLFVVSTLRPELLPQGNHVGVGMVTLKEAIRDGASDIILNVTVSYGGLVPQ